MANIQDSVDYSADEMVPDLSRPDLWIARLLISQLPKGLLLALRTMAKLQYPILDRQSLLAQIDDRQDGQDPGTEQEQSAWWTIRTRLGPRDFPILSPVSGIEKLYDPLRDLFIPDDRDTLPGVGDVDGPIHDVREAYRRALGLPQCVEVAWQAYKQYRRDGYRADVAFALGLLAGKVC